jgi:hypothetical protein
MHQAVCLLLSSLQASQELHGADDQQQLQPLFNSIITYKSTMKWHFMHCMLHHGSTGFEIAWPAQAATAPHYGLPM